jgi:hypothetical protein
MAPHAENGADHHRKDRLHLEKTRHRIMKKLANVLLLAALCISATAQSKPPHAAEQHSFGLGMDGPVVQHPVVISDAELAALANDDLMHRELDQDPPITKLTREGLEAAVVHLHGPNERDLIVVGSGAPFMGANVGPFWVIRDLPTGPQVVLSTITLSLEIQRVSSNGLRNIETLAATAVEGSTTKFRFNGTKYVLFKESSFPLGQSTH